MNELEKYIESQKIPRTVKTKPQRIYVVSCGNDVHFIVREMGKRQEAAENAVTITRPDNVRRAIPKQTEG